MRCESRSCSTTVALRPGDHVAFGDSQQRVSKGNRDYRAGQRSVSSTHFIHTTRPPHHSGSLVHRRNWRRGDAVSSRSPRSATAHRLSFPSSPIACISRLGARRLSCTLGFAREKKVCDRGPAIPSYPLSHEIEVLTWVLVGTTGLPKVICARFPLFPITSLASLFPHIPRVLLFTPPSSPRSHPTSPHVPFPAGKNNVTARARHTHGGILISAPPL